MPNYQLNHNMPVSQDETALSRGRLPSYVRRQALHLLSLLLSNKVTSSRNRTRLCMVSPRLLFLHAMYNCHRSTSLLISTIFWAIYEHFYSFDMFVRPTALFHQPPLLDPVAELPSSEFYKMCGFWPGLASSRKLVTACYLSLKELFVLELGARH